MWTGRLNRLYAQAGNPERLAFTKEQLQNLISQCLADDRAQGNVICCVKVLTDVDNYESE